MRKRVLIPVVVVAVAVIGVATVTVTQSGSAGSDTSQQVAFGTAQVAVRDLIRTELLSGVVAYTDLRELSSAQSGIVTWLPGAGVDLTSGQVLMRVNDRPVVLLSGAVPAWRDLKPGMSDGVDVLELETALQALGYAITPDDHWSSKTTTVVKQFQEKAGAEVDGVLSLGEVVFTAGNVHVAKLDAHVGGMITPDASVMTVQNTDRVVIVEVDPLERDLIVQGAPVAVELPSGDQAPGKIQSVSTTLQNNADGKGVFQVTIELDDPAQVSGLALAPVTVHYAATVAKQALSVPLTAIVAVPGGGYAVDVVRADGSHQRVPVKLGAWGDGFVQVTGDLVAGDTVEVPK